MHKMAIGADMSRHFWYANTNQHGVVPLEATYSKNTEVKPVVIRADSEDSSDESSGYDSDLDDTMDKSYELKKGDSEVFIYLVPFEDQDGPNQSDIFVAQNIMQEEQDKTRLGSLIEKS